MKPSDTNAVVGDIKKCLKNFGFSNVRHDFAHFGGDAHDIQHINDNIEYMIKRKKPVIMLSGTWDSSADVFKWIQGHVYVLDGYKKDSTGEYLHINWGWAGAYDGYYAKGCFDLTERAGYEESVDDGTSGNDTVDFNFFHYYVYF